MATRIDFTGRLEGVTKMPDGKFCFKITGRAGGEYRFLLTGEKALKVANQNSEFPTGVDLHITGLKTEKIPTVVDGRAPTTITYAKILSVDGHDVQSWAERIQSPTVAPDVLEKAKRSIDEAEEAAMKRRAPPEPPPTFKTPLEAYEKAMQRLRRQVRLKNPKLSKSDIWTIRDALNMLKETAGL